MAKTTCVAALYKDSNMFCNMACQHPQTCTLSDIIATRKIMKTYTHSVLDLVPILNWLLRECTSLLGYRNLLQARLHARTFKAPQKVAVSYSWEQKAL